MDIEKVLKKYELKDSKRIAEKSFKKNFQLFPHFNASKKKLRFKVKIIDGKEIR